MWGQQLFEPKTREDPKDQAWVFMKMTNKIKFKKKGGFRSMFGIEASYFLRFHHHGQYLGFYDSESQSVKGPSLVVIIGSVRAFSKESGHKIKFQFKNNEAIDFMFEGKADIDKWLTALKFFKAKQKVSPFGIENWDRVTWTTLPFSELDNETQWRILFDNESSFFETMNKRFDHDEFIHDKGLGDMFSYNSMDTLKNRVLLSKGGFKVNDIELDFDPNFDENNDMLLEQPNQLNFKTGEKDPGFQGIVGDIMASNNNFFLMVSNIPIADVDQELFHRDQSELNQEDMNLPHEVELYCIYVYEYKGKGDYRGSTHYIDMDSLQYAYIQGSFGNTFRLCLGNSKKEFELTFLTASEALHWLGGIRRCMEIAKRAGKVGMQKFIQTVKGIYHNLGQGDKIKIKKTLDDILLDNFQKIEEVRLKALEPDTRAQDMLQPIKEMKGMVREAIMELDFFLDAFVNHSTFNEQLFKFIVYRFGGTMRYFFLSYWLVLCTQAPSLNESLEFVFVVNLYLEMLEKWRLQDTTLGECRKTVCFTVSSQAFESSKKALTNLIMGIFQPAKQVKGKFQTTFLSQAFSHFGFLANTCFKHGERFAEVRPFLLRTLNKLLYAIFSHVLTEVKDAELDIEQSMALSQTNGMDEFRKFVTTFCGYTGMPAKDVRKGLNEDYFDRCIIQLETIGFDSFISIMKSNFEAMLDTYAKGIFTFDVGFFLNDFLQEYEDLINSADSDQQENIMSSLIQIFEERYLMNICQHSHIITKKNVDLLLDRIEADSDVVKAFFQLYLGDDMMTTDKLFDELELFIRAEEYESTLICLLNFQSLFPRLVTIDTLDRLLQLKVHFSPEVVGVLNEEFRVFFTRKQSNLRVQKNLSIIVGISSPIVSEFIKKIKKIHDKGLRFRELTEAKRAAFAFMYEEDAYQQMLTGKDENNRVSFGRGINAGQEDDEPRDKAQDSMRDVKAGVTMQEEINNEWGSRVFHLEKFVLPAINNWGLIEARFKVLKRESAGTTRVHVKFDEEVIKVSLDFFGQKGVSIYNYRVMENLRRVGSQGFSFMIGQKCYGFFLISAKKERNRTRGNDADKFISLIKGKIDNLDKDVYEGVNLHRLHELDLSENLGAFELEIQNEPFVYNFQEERETVLKEGTLKITKGRKESVELEEDLF